MGWPAGCAVLRASLIKRCWSDSVGGKRSVGQLDVILVLRHSSLLWLGLFSSCSSFRFVRPFKKWLSTWRSRRRRCARISARRRKKKSGVKLREGRKEKL